MSLPMDEGFAATVLRNLAGEPAPFIRPTEAEVRRAQQLGAAALAVLEIEGQAGRAAWRLRRGYRHRAIELRQRFRAMLRGEDPP